MALIKHLFHIDVKSELVFKALTEVEGLRNWWTHDTRGSATQGSVLEFRFGENGFIVFLVDEVTPGRIFWECQDAHPEWLGTTAEFILTPMDSGTRVHFTHDGWKKETDFYGSCNYSWGLYFSSLKDYCETGIGKPFKSDT